ncbi:protein NO VEIN-like isoform X2 [Amblyraja radiata]|uniref:protein NO VEIN-like isoform X2 n=1 Tax=Amblyraja radiata TaxID=386614 RepID=UPI001403FDCF|nr:protein NO VEIN-like isoform X2 [Amblyraja radiata]
MDLLRKEISELCLAHPEGFPLSQLSSLYLQMYERPLQLSDYGLQSVLSMLGYMESVISQHFDGQNLIIKPAAKKGSIKYGCPPISMSETVSLANQPRIQKPAPKLQPGNKLSEIRKEVLDLLKVQVQGIPARRLALVYKRFYKRPIQLDTCGLKSVHELLHIMRKEVYVQPTGNKCRVFKNKQLAVKLMEELRSQLLELFVTEPDGIREATLPECYRKKYKRKLKAGTYGYTNLKELLKSMDDVLEVVQVPGLGNVYRLKSTQACAVSKGEEDKIKVRLAATTLPAGVKSAETVFKNFSGPQMFPPPSQPQAPAAMLGLPTFPTSNQYPVCTPAGQLTFVSSKYQAALPSQTAMPLQSCSERGARPKNGKEEETAMKNPLSTSNFVHTAPSGKANPEGQPVASFTFAQNGGGSVWVGQRSASPARSLVSQDDFPTLSKNVPKEKLRQLKEEELAKKRSIHRYPQNYYAQVREEHNSVMQERETLASDNLVQRRNMQVNLEDVNKRVEEFIRALAAEREYVTEEKVVNRVCKYFRVSHLKDLGIWHPIKLPAIRELRQTQREIVTFIEAFEGIRCICTLYELSQCLAALKNKKNFEELNLGPLCKHPHVHRIFKVPPSMKDEDIFEIETVDILQSLNTYRRSKRGCKIDLAEFIKYLADGYHCDSPYDLGIRITSIGLSISTLSKSAGSERGAMENARTRIESEIEEEVRSRMHKVKKNLLDPASGPQLYSTSGCLDLRKQYASNTAAEAVLQVFSNASEVFGGRMTKSIQEFLVKVGDNRLARSLFQLAICCGSLDIPQDLVAKEKVSKAAVNGAGDREAPPPSEGSVRKYLQTNLSSVTGYLSLVYLSRLEKKLVEHFKLKGFVAIGHGTFLEYLVKHSQLLEEAAGGSVFLQPQEARNCGFRPSHQDVYEFIRQCGTLEESMFPAIEAALRSQYKVKDSKELGHGALPNMIKMVQCRAKLNTDHNSSQSLVLYEATFFVQEPSYCITETNNCVGLLGELSKEQALTCLLNAPLLENLSQWSEWELVFEPQHGSLKDFIERHCGEKATQLSVEGLPVLNDLIAIEIKPGVLLRLTTDTSPELFAQAVKSHDPIGTAGHLVSIVTADGLRNAPLALLANHVESALATLGSSEGSYLGAERLSSDQSAKFIIDCLVRIPIRLCKSLLQKVFLEPFSRIVGQCESKELLLQTAKCSLWNLNRLHELGILLGITEWRRDYQSKLDPTKLRPIASKTVRTVDSASLSSRSSCVGLSDDEDVNIPVSESEIDAESNCASSVADDDDDDKFVLADEPDDLPTTDEKPSELTDDATAQNGVPSDADDRSSGEECSVEAINEEHSQYKSIIDDIRKNEFGIGIELNEEGKRLMQIHQNRLGRSLTRLSTELYSKDTHFVLELIQNADDNKYPTFDGEAAPSLLFVVERDCIILLNNECGFEEKNIRAICDVGCSTKGKHKYGYIGQKGIGFKSVFKVTDRPEIHSNGFHICFDKLSGPMGYILPHWAEDQRPVELTGSEAEKARWTTKIVLPLKPQNQQMQNLFHDIDPSLLLFLHRLRSITIINKVKGQDFLVTRKDLANNILEVKHRTGADHWLVVKSILDARKIKDNVECTELALAFKLVTEKRSQRPRSQPEKQPVFAFLPLRSFGFRFIIQGDFDIPSSREDIDRDSPWNQWLRSEIPLLFLKAMETFNNHPSFDGLEGLCHFLPFIPLPDEILDFFRPVAGQIIQILKAKSCLPIAEDEAGRIEYRLPSQIAITHDILLQEVITAELLEKHLSLAYLNPVLQSSLSPALVSALGIHRLSSTDIIAVTKAIAKELAETNPPFNDGMMKKIAKLLVCNYRSLEQEYGNLDQFIEDLKSVPIIPLADGSMAAWKDQAIFFPLYDKENEQFTKPTPGLQDLYLDLKTIHPDVLSCLDNLGNSQVRKLLEKMDVHYLQPDTVMHEHILPILKDQKWKNKLPGVVISYGVFLKMHWQENELQQFRPHIPILTSKGFVCPFYVNVNFSPDYKNVVDLPADLPGVDWVLVDSCYLKTDQDSDAWRTFLISLGVQDSFIFQKRKMTFTKQELASSPWAPIYECWPDTADNVYIVEDYVCEELHGLLTTQDLSEKLKQTQRMNLLKLLDKNWDSGSRLSQFCSARVFDSQEKVLRNDVDSSFAIYLKTLPWLPTDSPAPDGPGFHSAYLRPIEAYLRSNDLVELLADNVSYVSCELLEKSTFAAFAGIKSSLTVEMMINHFKSWCVKTPSEPGDVQGAEFRAKVDHIYKVYAYFERNCNRNQLKDLFEQYPAVFMPSSDLNCPGKFFHQKEVCWNDPTKIFHRYKSQIQEAKDSLQEPHLLAPFYGHKEDMKNLFLKSLNVELIPSMKHYVDLLVLICGSVSLPNTSVLQDVSVIYAILAEKCKKYNEYGDSWELIKGHCQTLKGMIKDEKIFPAKDNRWVSLANHPILPDDKHLERMFKAQSLCFLTRPAAEKYRSQARNSSKQENRFNEEDRNLFFDICGVVQLSSCVTVEAQTEDFRLCPRVQNFVHSIIPFIQRLFYHHSDFSDVYKELQDSNIAASLKSMAFYQVGKLYLYYQLTLPDKPPVFEQENIDCHLKNKKTFYIQKDHVTSFIDICRELVKLFDLNKELEKELEHFLQRLVSCLEDENTLQRFFKKEDVGELPEGEEAWEVSAAPEINMEPRFTAGKATVPVQGQSVSGAEAQKKKDDSTDEERTLGSWPPRSSLYAYPDATPNKAAETVMKMWPPPAPPSDSGNDVPSGRHQLSPLPQTGGQGNFMTTAGPKPNVDQAQHLEHHNNLDHSSNTVHVERSANSDQMMDSVQTKPSCLPTTENNTLDGSSAVAKNHSSHESSQSGLGSSRSHFNGANTSRPALPLDVPVWTKEQPHEEALEELIIHSAVGKPQTVIFTEDKMENAAIGEWGERFVHAFLMHWQGSESELRPSAVSWVNEKGESGLPYDFKVVFTSLSQQQVDTFIEVKSTVKAEKNYVQLSAQEMDLALRAKDRYHLYRVYKAGDSQNVKLCRIKNLAQCLHAKQLELFLYV